MLKRRKHAHLIKYLYYICNLRKNYRQKLLTMKKILLLFITVMLTISASAYDFMVGNLCYFFLIDEGTVGVAPQNAFHSPSYSGLNGSLSIPGCVTYNGNTYIVTTIGSAAFSGCSGLTSVTIPNTVTVISRRAFEGCSNLTSINITNSVTTIDENAFTNTSWFNNQPDGLVYAGFVAYKYKGTMPANTSIALREGTKGIAAFAFYECSGLTSITIPNSVTNISYSAFSDCVNLNEIRSKIVDVGSVTMRGNDVFSGVPTSTCMLKVPIGRILAYKQAAQWSDFKNIKQAIMSSIKVGDLNCDNVVNGSDINIMVNLLIGSAAYDDPDSASDINCDGRLSGADLNKMISIILDQ